MVLLFCSCASQENTDIVHLYLAVLSVVAVIRSRVQARDERTRVVRGVAACGVCEYIFECVCA